MFTIVIFSLFGILVSVILIVLITSTAKAVKRKKLISRLDNADIFLSDGLCDEAQKALTEVMQQLFTSFGDPIFPDLVFRCFYGYGRYSNLCGRGSKSSANESIANYEKCLDCFARLNDVEKTPELTGLKYECEYRLGLLYLDKAEGMTSTHRSEQLLRAEHFLLMAMGNVEELSKVILSDTVVAKPEIISARIKYALAKTYHLLYFYGSGAREMYLLKCIGNASSAIDDFFSRNDFPSEWEQMVKLRTEACIDLCGYEGGHEHAGNCVNFQNEYIDYLKSEGRLSDAFACYVRLGNFHMKTAKPGAATDHLLTEDNKYVRNMLGIFGGETTESSTGEAMELRRHIDAAHHAYISALELCKAAVLPKNAIGNAYREMAKSLIAMYRARTDENYLIDAVEAMQQCLDYCNIPIEQSEALLILGRLFMMLGAAKSDPKNKKEFFLNARRTYKQAADEYIRDSDLAGRRYAEDMLREVAVLMLKAES